MTPNRQKSVRPPAIAPPTKTIPELSKEAASRGRRRITGSRAASRIASPGFGQAARVARSELKETLA